MSLAKAVDDPVAIKIGIGVGQRVIVADLVRLVFGIASDVQPESRPSLGVIGGGEESSTKRRLAPGRVSCT